MNLRFLKWLVSLLRNNMTVYYAHNFHPTKLTIVEPRPAKVPDIWLVQGSRPFAIGCLAAYNPSMNKAAEKYDMKGGVAMMLAAFLRSKVEGQIPPGDVVLAILCDEITVFHLRTRPVLIVSDGRVI